MSQEHENKDGQRTTMGERETGNGVAAIIELLHVLFAFLKQGDITRIDQLKRESIAILTLLQDPILEPVFKERPKSKLSYAATTAFDILFRVKARPQVMTALDFIYQLDVFMPLRQWPIPGISFSLWQEPKGKQSAESGRVYHPELKEPVPNSLEMHAGKSVVFLTGAIMAGKSTFLRSYSTAVYIAHMGFPWLLHQWSFRLWMESIQPSISRITWVSAPAIFMQKCSG